jgi:hypothetical protein
VHRHLAVAPLICNSDILTIWLQEAFSPKPLTPSSTTLSLIDLDYSCCLTLSPLFIVSQETRMQHIYPWNTHLVCDSSPCKAGSCVHRSLCVSQQDVHLRQSNHAFLRTDGSTLPISTLSGRYTPGGGVADGHLWSISLRGCWPLPLLPLCSLALMSRRLITAMLVPAPSFI